MDGQSREAVGKTRRRTRAVALKFADDGPQARLRLLRAARPIESRPVGSPDPFVEQWLLGQLGQDVAQPMDRAALPVGIGPEFGYGPDESGCAVVAEAIAGKADSDR